MAKLNEFLKDNTYVFKMVGFIATIIGLFVTADGYIDNKIEQKITDTAYISKLANQLRPFLIFDDNGIIQFDHGAEKKIKNILVNKEKKVIEIETNEYLQIAPFIMAVGSVTYSFKPERVGNRKWRYTMLYYDPVFGGWGSNEEPTTGFVLEILYSQ